MAGDTTTGSSNSKSSSPAVNSAVNKLATGLGNEYTQGKSLYTAPGANTQAGWAASLGAANNPSFNSGIAGALQSYGNRASGAELGLNDPLYAQQRANLTDDVLTDVNSIFTGSGRFGSGSHVGSASEGLGRALGGLDLQQRNESYGRQSEAANMLPQLFAAGQLPSSIQQSVGASQDASAAAQAAGPTDYLAKLTSILAGNSASAGTSTTESKPLWRELLGLGVSAL